jgi:dTMP kinase
MSGIGSSDKVATARGLFCVFEGGDGSGKTSVLAQVQAQLAAEGIPALATREPGGTPEGLALRQLLLGDGAYHWTPDAELLLINAARAQHVAKVLAPALAVGGLVLCDRFIGSTLAYQGAGHGIAEERIRALHRYAVGEIWPDLTILLDLDPEQALERSRRRLDAAQSDEGRFEALDLDFHRRVRQSFLEQAARAPQTHVVIDASRPKALVEADALRALRAALDGRR